MTPPLPTPLDAFRCPLDGINLIEASAGTGKTWNICVLVLRLLLERRLPVQSILVVTFTNAATAELRGRVRARLAETLTCLSNGATGSDPFARELAEAVCHNAGMAREEMAKLMAAALAAFDEAAIYTIHGFCQRVLAETPFAARLPFALELIEDDAEPRAAAVADFWRRRIAAPELPPLVAAWLERCGDTPQAWAEFLARLQAKPLAAVRWPDGIERFEAPDGAALEAAFREAHARWLADGPEAAGRVLANLGALNGVSYQAESVQAAVRAWDEWFACGDPLAPPDDRLKLLRASFLAERTKKNRLTPSHPFFDAAEALLGVQTQTAEGLARMRLRLLRDMAVEAGAQLRRSKRERRVLSFDDILFNAWDALRGERGTALVRALRRRYPAALIDEFQDTDPLQFAVFDAIYGGGDGGPLFLVGDPKQAIYSFRNADLHTYLAARGRARRLHTLADNQRSVEGLIEACNRLFGANPRAFVIDGMDFRPARLGLKPRRRLSDASSPQDAPLRVWRLPGADSGHLLRGEAMARSVQASAAEIAHLLRESAAGRISLDGRGLQAADIAVLVRSHAHAALVKQALAALGIDSVEVARDSVFSTPDAEELERVLTAILEPGRTPLLLAAFATELMGLDAPALLALSSGQQALPDAVARFAGYRELWLDRGFGFMLRRWFDAEGIARRLLCRGDGERRLTNLLHLAELLARASRDRPDPDALMRWLATRRAEAGGGEEAQLRLESDRKLVQIVTVHKSKGLEYDIVFCPLLWLDPTGSRPDGEGLAYHDDAGNAVIDLRPEAAQDAEIKQRRRREADAEAVRLTYVALTRAAQRCYLVAGCYLQAAGRGQPSATRSTRSLLNWLVAGAGADHDAWRDGSREPGAIEEAWRAFAQAAAPHVLIEALPDGRGEPLPDDGPRPESLAALPPPARIPAAWRVGSYSSLSHGADHEAAAADHDGRVAVATPAAPPPSLAQDDILRFPRGPAAGECLHAAFEHADFAEPASWEPAVDRALAEHPQPLSGTGSTGLRRMLLGMLGDVLGAPLVDGIVLADLEPGRRLSELAFHIPAAGLDAATLNAWLKARGLAMPRLAFATLEGYLTGYIDLVFAHGGRYYLLDWKSNLLGYGPEDYAPRRLEAAMAEHGYALQYLIYAVALHRYLGRRLPDYDYELHFGGVLYLFVRGVRPGWKDGQGIPAGVWFRRPPRATVVGFDALLAGARS